MTKHEIYLFATGIAPIVLICVVVSLFLAQTSHGNALYRLSFYAMLLAVLLMELRVRLGYRTIRGKLFYMHLIFAIPFLISLGVLAFYMQPLWLVVLCDILLVALAIAGLTLFRRSILSGFKMKNI